MRVRPSTVLFALVCAGGSAASLGLAVHEARREDPVVAEVAATSRDGLTSVVQVQLRNTTPVSRCTGVRLVAQDRAGRDLGDADLGPVHLAGGATSRTSGRVELSPADYAERLTGFRVVLSDCSAERPMQK